MLREPLDPESTRRLIRSILLKGTVGFSRHALKEMAADGLITPDILNVLRSGVVEPAELERRTWRYRVRTPNAYVVVAFRSEKELIVVTSWSRK